MPNRRVVKGEASALAGKTQTRLNRAVLKRVSRVWRRVAAGFRGVWVVLLMLMLDPIPDLVQLGHG
jgi:hypothetical protein